MAEMFLNELHLFHNNYERHRRNLEIIVWSSRVGYKRAILKKINSVIDSDYFNNKESLNEAILVKLISIAY